uniref:Uncharacterized protein n=1 Tax=Arundo donax TaxID=35708 RepID=A0A0A9RWB4_ARUDO
MSCKHLQDVNRVGAGAKKCTVAHEKDVDLQNILASKLAKKPCGIQSINIKVDKLVEIYLNSIVLASTYKRHHFFLPLQM